MDIACWRQAEGYVIRLWGSERILSYNEWCELRMLMSAIDDGANEALGEGYQALVEANLHEPIKTINGNPRTALLALGLIKEKPPIKRRA